MITRAYIIAVKPDSAKVRIPILNGWDPSATNYTPDESLPWASIVAIPGIVVSFKPGDVVLIGLQDNDAGAPLILGHLKSAIGDLNENDLPIINTSVLEAREQVILPKDTKIGNLTYDNLDNPPSTDIQSISNAEIDELF